MPLSLLATTDWSQELAAICASLSSTKQWAEVPRSPWYSSPHRPIPLSAARVPSPHHLTWAYLKSKCWTKSPPRVLDLLLFPLLLPPGVVDLGSDPKGAGRTGHIAQSTSHSPNEALGVSSEWPASNKGEVPANVQEVISWSCPIWYLWGLQKVAAGYFALKSHQEWRGMLSSHLLISFQNSMQKMWH